MPTITIPKSINDKGLISFFTGWEWNREPTGPIKLDFSENEFLAPYAVTLFSAYYLWLRGVKKKHPEIKYTPNSLTHRYLSNSGFLELVEQGKTLNQTIGEERIVKLCCIKESKQISPFATNVMDILAIEDEEVANAVKYALIELLRNVVQHSSSLFGGVAMAQYFPKTGLVEICVADCGIGIASTLARTYPEISSDIQAIKFATQPHVSGTFQAHTYNAMNDNAGLGLFFIKQITSLASGRFFLGSGNSIISIWGDKDGEQNKSLKKAKKNGWNGTFAYLQLNKYSINEFDEILSSCRKLSAEARKKPSELALDFISDISDLEDLKIINVIDFEEDVEKAAFIRDTVIIPTIDNGEMVIINFDKVKFATQSFIHALMYKIIRDGHKIGSTLSIANCTSSTKESILTVAAYASISNNE